MVLLLGHLSHKVTTFFACYCLMSLSLDFSSSFFCESYHYNKSLCLPFGESSLYVCTNVWGPSPIESIDVYSHYIIFVGHFTIYVWLYPLHHKVNAYSTFYHFKFVIENYFKTSSVYVYSNVVVSILHSKCFFASFGI